MRIATYKRKLEWCALYLTKCNTIPCKRGERVEIEAADGDDSILIVRSGKTIIEAFFKCINAGMQRLPRRSK